MRFLLHPSLFPGPGVEKKPGEAILEGKSNNICNRRSGLFRREHIFLLVSLLYCTIQCNSAMQSRAIETLSVIVTTRVVAQHTFTVEKKWVGDWRAKKAPGEGGTFGTLRIR